MRWRLFVPLALGSSKSVIKTKRRTLRGPRAAPCGKSRRMQLSQLVVAAWMTTARMGCNAQQTPTLHNRSLGGSGQAKRLIIDKIGREATIIYTPYLPPRNRDWSVDGTCLDILMWLPSFGGVTQSPCRDVGWTVGTSTC